MENEARDVLVTNKRPTQCDRVLDYIKRFGSITTYEAIMDLGILRLGARISEMRSNGINIQGEMIAVKNRLEETCYVKRYWLGEKENNNG